MNITDGLNVSGGSANIGTSGAPEPLNVNGVTTAGVSGSSASTVNLTVNGAETVTGILNLSTTTTFLGLPTGSAIYFNNAGSNEALIFNTINGSTSTLVLTAPAIDLNGSVTAGPTSSTANNLTVNGAATITASVAGALGPTLTLQNTGASAGAATAIFFDTYNIGANAHCARLESIDDGSSSNHLTFSTKTPGSATNALVERMRLSSSGNLGIGNTAPTHTLDVTGTANVTGALTAGSLSVSGVKSFRIPHPTHPDRDLVHGCIEGAEAGVYYRGEACLSDGVATIELPPYFEALTRPEGRTVQVTPIWDGDKAPCSPLCATQVREGRFLVRAIDRANSTQRFHWEVKAVRADIARLDIEPPKRR